MNIVLDTGAVIASESNDRAFTALLLAAQKQRSRILLPATVVAESWRGPGTSPLVGRLLKTVDAFPHLDVSSAKRTGDLLAKSQTVSIVDGNVVEVALTHIPATIVTSDPNDIRHLLQSAGVSFDIFGGGQKLVDVLIVRI